jgi:hypothetical protein
MGLTVTLVTYADRYVCECEGWEPVDNAYTKNDTTAGVFKTEILKDDETV